MPSDCIQHISVQRCNILKCISDGEECNVTESASMTHFYLNLNSTKAGKFLNWFPLRQTRVFDQLGLCLFASLRGNVAVAYSRSGKLYTVCYKEIPLSFNFSEKKYICPILEQYAKFSVIFQNNLLHVCIVAMVMNCLGGEEGKIKWLWPVAMNA